MSLKCGRCGKVIILTNEDPSLDEYVVCMYCFDDTIRELKNEMRSLVKNGYNEYD